MLPPPPPAPYRTRQPLPEPATANAAASLLPTPRLHLDHLDHRAIDLVHLRREAAIASEDAELAIAALWSGADVAIDALGVVAVAAEAARRHARDECEVVHLLGRGLVVVAVRAARVRAGAAEVVEVADLELLDAVDLVLIVLDDRVDALAAAVARNAVASGGKRGEGLAARCQREVDLRGDSGFLALGGDGGP